MPSISNFGYSIILRHLQYLAPWMHTLSPHPTHPKTRQNDTILSQTKHGQTSPTLTPTSIGLLSLPLYEDVNLWLNWSRRLGCPCPEQIHVLKSFTLLQHSHLLHTCWLGYPHNHSQHNHYFTCPTWQLGKFHEQKVPCHPPPIFFKLPCSQRKAILWQPGMIIFIIVLLGSPVSCWFSSSVSLILLYSDVTPRWSSSILGPLKRVGLSYLQAGLMSPLTSAVTIVTGNSQDLTPRCQKSDTLYRGRV